MKSALWVVALIGAVGLLVSACGSGGEPGSTETPRSERAQRQATIMQQEGREADQLGVIDFGHREGLPFLRNSVGDPEAPVVIVEYSDFQ